jgi:hypothetical protein
MNKNKGVSVEEARKIVINNEAKRRGLKPYEYRSSREKLAINILNSKGKLTKEMQDLKSSYENASKTFRGYLDEKAKIDKLSPESAALSKVKPLTMDVQTSSWKKEFKKVTLTAQDQYDLSLVYQDMSSWFNSDDEVKQAENATKRLAARGYTPTMINNLRYQFMGDRPKNVKPEDWKNFIDVFKNSSTIDIQDAYKKRAEAIKNNVTLNNVARKPLISGDTKVDTARKEALASYVSAYASNEQNESPNLVNNAPAMLEILKDDKKGTVQFSAKKDEVSKKITSKAIFYNANGEVVGEVTLSPKEAAASGFSPERSFTSAATQEVTNRMEVINNGTTSFGDVKDPETYINNDVIYTKEDFKNLKSMPYDFKGNLKKGTVVDRGGNSREVYYNYLYINGPSPKVYQLPINKGTIEEALALFDQLTPDMVNQLIKENK